MLFQLAVDQGHVERALMHITTDESRRAPRLAAKAENDLLARTHTNTRCTQSVVAMVLCVVAASLSLVLGYVPTAPLGRPAVSPRTQNAL